MKRKINVVKPNDVSVIGNDSKSSFIYIITSWKQQNKKKAMPRKKKQSRPIKHIESAAPANWTLDLLLDLVEKYKCMKIVKCVILKSLPILSTHIYYHWLFF